jgi:beta-glucanase (GH16 family)
MAFTQTPTYHNDLNWQLKWEDQFTSFDNSKWYKGNYGIHGGEPQLFLKEQVWTSSDGNIDYLMIELNNTPVICPTPQPPEGACPPCVAGKTYNYRSGVITTTKGNATQFGYIEARMKLPFRRENGKSFGFFPAFWTAIQWDVLNATNVAEIDIFEIFGGSYEAPNVLCTAIHTCYIEQDPTCNENYVKSYAFSNFSYTDWHTYSIEWDANRIIWYVDGIPIRTLFNHNIVDPIRIILNLAAMRNEYLPPTSPPFQEYMYVDYVKVYQLKCDKYTVVNEISNFNTYNYAVKKSITLSNATTIPANSNITLRATDFIQLNAGFEVPAGSELYLDINPIPGACAVSAPPIKKERE